MDAERFARACRAIDAANSDDPNHLVIDGIARPRALAEGELVADWIERLDPDAGEELRLAARAHHLRRWRSPRSGYPEGRSGYLRWRRDLHELHAAEVGAILAAEGYEPATVERVQDLVRKRGLRAQGSADPEVQALEDAICLAFLQAELGELTVRLDRAHMVDVLVKTMAKMSDPAKQLALALDLPDDQRSLVLDAAAQAEP